MRKVRLLVGAGSIGLLAAGVVFVACGGSEATSCGPGTVNVNGVCQIVGPDGANNDATSSDGDSPDTSTPDDGGTTADAIADVDSGPPNRCPYGKGPVMAEIPNLFWDAGTFCIDTTEVSEGQYDQFLKAIGGGAGDAGVQPPGCGDISNPSYTPGVPPTSDGPYTYDPANHANLPVRGVDWCDAYMYCAWAGKRLCQRWDKSTPPLDGGNWKSYETNIACSQNQQLQKYAYGSTYQPGWCAPIPIGDAAPVPVGTSKCRGSATPYDQVFDTSGNVAEWTGACATVASCRSSGTFQCDVTGQPGALSAHLIYQGIRCCAD